MFGDKIKRLLHAKKRQADLAWRKRRRAQYDNRARLVSAIMHRSNNRPRLSLPAGNGHLNLY